MYNSFELFQVSGTLSEDAKSYIKRPADDQLLAALDRNELCLVLAPRQSGKSSLMVHSLAPLKKKGFSPAIVDLQALGSHKNLDEWLRDVAYQIERSLKITTDLEHWWQNHQWIGPTLRFRKFLEDVVLKQSTNKIIVFFDEIDSALKLHFSHDFFTLIRAMYNDRAIEPQLKRLNFVLIGVATAASFTKDTDRTPFNIGKSIELTDFDRESVKYFEEVLGPNSKRLVDRILFWTNGQPFLVQKLAATVYALTEEERSSERVDIEVNKLFSRQIEKDTHFKFIQNYLLDSTSNVIATLRVYKRILEGHKVAADEKSSIQSRLKLSGIVRMDSNYITYRNLIYKNIFDLDWTKKHLYEKIKQKMEKLISPLLFLFSLLVIYFIWGNPSREFNFYIDEGVTYIDHRFERNIAEFLVESATQEKLFKSEVKGIDNNYWINIRPNELFLNKITEEDDKRIKFFFQPNSLDKLEWIFDGKKYKVEYEHLFFPFKELNSSNSWSKYENKIVVDWYYTNIPNLIFDSTGISLGLQQFGVSSSASVLADIDLFPEKLGNESFSYLDMLNKPSTKRYVPGLGAFYIDSFAPSLVVLKSKRNNRVSIKLKMEVKEEKAKIPDSYSGKLGFGWEEIVNLGNRTESIVLFGKRRFIKIPDNQFNDDRAIYLLFNSLTNINIRRYLANLVYKQQDSLISNFYNTSNIREINEFKLYSFFFRSYSDISKSLNPFIDNSQPFTLNMEKPLPQLIDHYQPLKFNNSQNFHLKLHCEAKFKRLAQYIHDLINSTSSNVVIDNIILYTRSDLANFRKNKFRYEKGAILLDEYSLYSRYKQFPVMLYFRTEKANDIVLYGRFNYGGWNISELNYLLSNPILKPQKAFLQYQYDVHQKLIEKCPALFLFRRRYGYLIEEEFYAKQKVDLVGFYNLEKNLDLNKNIKEKLSELVRIFYEK